MKQILCRRTAIAVLAFPIAALADLNQTTTLQANTTLNLETGATATSGGDILWNGSTITPQGRCEGSAHRRPPACNVADHASVSCDLLPW